MRPYFAGGCALLVVSLLGVGGVTLGPDGEQREPAERAYVARAVSVPPAIDGVLDDPAWVDASWTAPFVDIRGEGWPAPAHETRAKIAWDEDHLYVAFRLDEPHLWGTLTARDAIIYRDNDIEIFLDPEGDGLDYYEVEINALGTVMDLFLAKPYRQGGRADLTWDASGMRSAVALDGTLNDPSDVDRSWSVEFAIPWRDLAPPSGSDGSGRVGAAPHPGDTWRVNFSRVQWPLRVVDGRYQKVREPVDWTDHPEDNWVWSPQGEINMHIPERWGAVTFVAGRVP